MGLVYNIGKYSIKLYLSLTYRVKVYGKENIPKTGAAIICCNHISHNDPLVIACYTRRAISFLAKKELFKNKFLVILFKLLYAIPVDRGSNDISAFKSALSELKKGRLLCVFAQGTRMKEMDAKNAKSGVALFAAKSGAPVIPIFISTEYKRGETVIINIGKPVEVEDLRGDGKKLRTETLNKITERIVNEINTLKMTK